MHGELNGTANGFFEMFDKQYIFFTEAATLTLLLIFFTAFVVTLVLLKRMQHKERKRKTRTAAENLPQKDNIISASSETEPESENIITTETDEPRKEDCVPDIYGTEISGNAMRLVFEVSQLLDKYSARAYADDREKTQRMNAALQRLIKKAKDKSKDA